MKVGLTSLLAALLTLSASAFPVGREESEVGCTLADRYVSGTDILGRKNVVFSSLHVPAGVARDLTSTMDGVTIAFQETSVFGTKIQHYTNRSCRLTAPSWTTSEVLNVTPLFIVPTLIWQQLRDDRSCCSVVVDDRDGGGLVHGVTANGANGSAVTASRRVAGGVGAGLQGKALVLVDHP